MVNGYYTQMCKIKPNSVVVYNKWTGKKSTAMQEVNLLDNFNGNKEDPTKETRKSYCGQMTVGARKRMIETVELFASTVKERWVYNKFQKKKVKHTFSFITLTIPENNRRVPGKEAYKKLLEPFISWLRENKVNTYVWKAELQSPLDFQGRVKVSQGQLHYHIILPNWICKYEIRKKWNYLLIKNNLNAGHNDAPSTSIEKPYKVKEVAAYIVKEICKNIVSTKEINTIESLLKQAEDNQEAWRVTLLENELARIISLQELQDISLGGKIWGCSYNLKPKKKLIEVYDKGASLGEIEFLIKDCTRTIKEIQADKCLFSYGEMYFSRKIEKLLAEKRLLYFLRKEKNRFYAKEKNYFEVEFTPKLFERLNLVYKFLEDSGNWNKNRNIFENDYVTIYKMPSYYWEIMLDIKYFTSDGKEVKYLNQYKNWKKDRVGSIMTEEIV